MTTYALDVEQAKQAEYTGSRIDATGKYIGKFTRAEDVKAKTGAVGVEFDFESNDGRKCRLNLYTKNVAGEPIFGGKMLMAIMTCMRVKGVESAPATVKKYDYDSKKEETISVPCFVALHSKPIGLLLQAEEYAKDGGVTGWKMNIAGCFDATSELTASEVLDKRTKPEQLVKMIAVLRDKPLRGSAPAKGKHTPNGHDPFDMVGDDFQI